MALVTGETGKVIPLQRKPASNGVATGLASRGEKASAPTPCPVVFWEWWKGGLTYGRA